jgi:hypothetical protein
LSAAACVQRVKDFLCGPEFLLLDGEAYNPEADDPDFDPAMFDETEDDETEDDDEQSELAGP